MRYTTREAAKILEVSDRTVRRYINTYISIDSKSFEISDKMLEVLKIEFSGQVPDSIRQQEYDVLEGFTKEEYQEFQKRLIEYPLLKEQLAHSKEYLDTLKNELKYHKSAYLRQLDIHEKMMDSVKQRNFIEAKEKGMDDN